ncbi:MAG: hypothetical protein K0S55_1117 [Clostridia bacterium]|jgi:preprotein translocase subunit YajC|nr:hypothetical protein [Clostridia bacterium]
MLMNNFLSLILSAAEAGAENAANAANELANVPIEQEFMKYAATFLPIIAIAVGFYFFLIRPQKKQEKEVQKMRNSIEVGDQITTIGGISGIIRQIKDDDTYIIETGADKSKIAIKKWAIQSKDTVSDK